MDFDQAFEFVFSEEGGYVNDPEDSGGETKYGISKRAHPSLDIKSLTKESVRPIYRKYWKDVKADILPNWLRLQLFDFGFTSGPKTSIKMLQGLAGVQKDGRVGPITIAAAKNVTIVDFYDARIDFYTNLAKRRPKDKRFLAGWKNRSKRALEASIIQVA